MDAGCMNTDIKISLLEKPKTKINATESSENGYLLIRTLRATKIRVLTCRSGRTGA